MTKQIGIGSIFLYVFSFFKSQNRKKDKNLASVINLLYFCDGFNNLFLHDDE